MAPGHRGAAVQINLNKRIGIMEFKTPQPRDLPDVQETQAGGLAHTQLTTSSNVAWLLSELGITLRFNMMTAEPLFHHKYFTEDERSQRGARRLVMDMCARMRIKGVREIDEILVDLARSDPYHPMEDWLKTLQWDGRDRIGMLANTIETDNPLWPDYLENWLIQAVEGVCGWRKETTDEGTVPLRYVLVLVGGQGIGKTKWFRNLGLGWIKTEAELHLSTPAGRDHQIEVLKHPIAELAELDGIFRKSDIGHMKAFISRNEDSIRAPYARVAIVRPRMTTLCASVNDPEFLVDASGSDRFWPVQVERIEWHFEMDWDQLWAQAYVYWQEDSVFTLTEAQNAQRAVIARETHTTMTPEEEVLREFYRVRCGDPKYPPRPMNRTEIARMLFGKSRSFSPKTLSVMGRVIADISGPPRTIQDKQRCWMWPYDELAYENMYLSDSFSLKSA
jgi:putative DNA primase/helicase